MSKDEKKKPKRVSYEFTLDDPPPPPPKSLTEESKRPFSPTPPPELEDWQTPDNDNDDEDFSTEIPDDDEFEEGAEEKAWQDDQDHLFEMADDILAGRTESLRTLHRVSDIDLLGVLTAGILRDELEGRIPDESFDRMIAANFLMLAGNRDEIIGEFNAETSALIAEFETLTPEESREERFEKIKNFSPDAKSLFLASTLAEMELVTAFMRADPQAAPDAKYLWDQANYLKQATTKVAGFDENLLDHTVDTFNAMCRISRYPLGLVKEADGKLALVRKDQPKFKPPGM
jgi:hypothetical protein